MTIDTNELRRLAQAASPGPWAAKNTSGAGLEIYMGHPLYPDKNWPAFGTDSAFCKKGLVSYETWTQFPHEVHVAQQSKNALYIAAANPATISELLDRLDRLDRLEAAEKELVEIRHGAAVANDTIKALRTKIAEMENQGPVAHVWRCDNGHVHGSCDSELLMGQQLYALPGAKGEEKMKLSEKIQEALREQQEINLSDPAVHRRLAAQWGYVPAGEQVAPVVKDERAAFREWFEGEQGVAYDGLWSFARAAWLARAALGAPSVPREAIEKMLTQLTDIAVSNGANSISMPDEYVEVAAWLCGIHAQPAPSVSDGWKEAAIAWEVCGSLHREYTKGKDPFFKKRQEDFVKHANDARAMIAAAPEAKP